MVEGVGEGYHFRGGGEAWWGLEGMCCLASGGGGEGWVWCFQGLEFVKGKDESGSYFVFGKRGGVEFLTRGNGCFI